MSAFLTKTKKPVLSNRNEFLNAKIIESIGGLSESNNGCTQCQKEYQQICALECTKCKLANQKLKEAKVLLKKSSHVNLQKDLLIDKMRSESQSDANKFESSLYQAFETSFDAADLKAIRSVLPGPSKDSTFVNKIMSALYKGSEFNKLCKRSAAGRRYKGIEKSGITPEKKDLIEMMLHERIVAESKDCPENSAKKRTSGLNRFIRSAIHNILDAEKKI